MGSLVVRHPSTSGSTQVQILVWPDLKATMVMGPVDASALRATDKCSVMDPLAGLVPRGKVGF